jgi:hypothetical protein
VKIGPNNGVMNRERQRILKEGGHYPEQTLENQENLQLLPYHFGC